MVRRGCRLARPPGGSVEQPVVNWRNAFRSSDDIPHRTRTKRVKPGLRAGFNGQHGSEVNGAGVNGQVEEVRGQ